METGIRASEAKMHNWLQACRWRYSLDVVRDLCSISVNLLKTCGLDLAEDPNLGFKTSGGCFEDAWNRWQ